MVSAVRRWAAATAVAAGAALTLVSPTAAAADDGGLTTTWNGDTVNVAWDGSPYDTATESFVGVPVAVPGDRAVRTLRVTNHGTSGGTLRAWIVDVDLQPAGQQDERDGVPQGSFYDDLHLTWDTASARGGASFAALAAGNRTSIATIHLAQGAATDLTLAYELPLAATSGNRSNAGALSAAFAVDLEITGDAASGGGDPTAGTGGGAVSGTGDGNDGLLADTSGAPGHSHTGSGALASTGAQVLDTAGIAVAALVTGALLVLVRRRRRERDATAPLGDDDPR